MKNFKLPNWHSDSTMIPDSLIDWVLDAGSFTKRLEHYGQTSPLVQVLYQGWQFPCLEERIVLGISPRVYALIREVLIYSKGVVCMFARTVFPMTTVTGKEQQFLYLKNRSLGSVLFNDPQIERGGFEFACIQSGMAWYEQVKAHVPSSSNELWARRSFFYIKNKPLLLAEMFLPALESLG